MTTNIKQNFKETNEDVLPENIETIASLREKGYRVRVYHYRVENGILNRYKAKKIQYNYKEFLRPQHDIAGCYRSPVGGKTSIRVTSPDGRESVGVAVCSIKDQFNRKIANEIALKRALEILDKIPLEPLDENLTDEIKDNIETLVYES